jgi:hypothetical protein
VKSHDTEQENPGSHAEYLVYLNAIYQIAHFALAICAQVLRLRTFANDALQEIG